MDFDIEGAETAGYTRREIADYLATQTDFDVESARKNGYADEEIISHLTQPSPQSGPLTGFAKGLYKGAVYGIPEQLGKAAQFLGVGGETAKKVAKWGEKGIEEGAEEKGVFRQTGEMIPLSAGVPIASHVIGSALMRVPNPYAMAAGLAIKIGGRFITPALFGLAQAQETKETALERGVEPGTTPYVTGGIEWAGETAANIALGRVLGPLAGVGRIGKAAIGKIGVAAALKGTIGGYLKQLALVVMPTEVLTEMGQNYTEALAEKWAGIRPEAEPGKEARAAIAPAALMTAILGPFGRVAQRHVVNKQAEILSQPIDSSDPDFTERVQMRAKVAEGVAEIIPKEDVGLHDQWLQYATDKINANQPIDISTSLDSLGMAIDQQMAEMPEESEIIKPPAVEPGELPPISPATPPIAPGEPGEPPPTLPTPPITPPIPSVAPEEVVPERRKNLIKRKRISELSPEEMREELLTDHLTRLDNKRAYNERERKSIQASLDVDSLKWVNDNFGHEAGNTLLETMGEAIRNSGLMNVYHFSGDEFHVEGDTPEEVNQAIAKARAYLKNTPMTFTDKNNIQYTMTADFSHGVGNTLSEAEANMREDKIIREESGKRVKRGEMPLGVKPLVTEPAPEMPEMPLEPKEPVLPAPVTPAKPEAKPAPKEPWEMTQKEWIDRHMKSPEMHREHVRIALSEGYYEKAVAEGRMTQKQVDNILKDYPDLLKEVHLTPRPLELLAENIQKALQERPERLTHGYTSKNAFWIDAEGNIYQHNKYQDIPQKTNLINVHSHMPDNYKEYPNKRWDTFNASDVHSGLIWTAKQKVGNKTVVITSPNTVDILSTTKNTDPSFYRKGIKSLEKELYSTEIGKASSENDRERLRAFSDKYRLNYEENVPIQAKGIKVEPLAGQVKPIGEEIPEKTISQFTQEYKEGLLGEGGFIRVGGVEKATPKVVTPSTKDVSLLEFPLTSLYVADQHPILAPIIKGNIKAEQNTNNWIFRYSDRVSQAFDKVERPLLFRTIFGRKGTAIRDIDLMIEGKKPIPTQLTGFVDDIKGVLGDVKGEVIQKMKNDFAESLSPKQKEYLDWVQGGKVGDKPKHVRAGTTKAVDEAFNQFKEMEKWGIQDYFPHIFKGKYKYLTEDGHIIASGQTAKQAKTNFEEYVESHPETTGNTFMFVNDFCDLLTVRKVLNPELTNPLEYLGTRLSRKEFFRLLGKTEKVIKEEIANAGVDDIPKVKVDMSGIASFQKGTKFSGHFLKRKTSLRGEETDPFRALMSYVFSVGRKLGLEDAKMASYSFADSLPKNMPNAKSYIKMQADLMSGRYNIVDKVFDETIGEKLGMKPFGVTRIFAKGVGLESKLKLGYAPAKTAINRIGGVFHTILQEGGKNYYEGKKLLKAKDPELIRRIQEEGHLAGMEQLFAGEGLIGVSEKQISWWRPLGTYQKAEVKNRSEALAAGYVAGLKKFGGDKDAAWIYAIDSTRLTQGLYNTAAKPVLVRGPVAQASYQFKQYLSNEIRFMSQLTPSQWAGYIAGITAVAGTRGALLTIKSIIGISIIGLGIDELMERLNRKAPRLHRGIFGLIGIDVSAPASWQIPSSIKDWVGVFPRDLWETGEMIIKGLKNKGWTDEQINDYVRQITPVGYNVFKGLQMLSEGVTKEGTKVIYRGGKEEGIINLTGARSVGQSQASDSARYMNQQRQLFLEKSKVLEDKLFGSKSAEEANNTFKELVELKNIQTPEEIQDFINGLRRSALSRQMTEEARIFMTLPRALKKEEIRRR